MKASLLNNKPKKYNSIIESFEAFFRDYSKQFEDDYLKTEITNYREKELYFECSMDSCIEYLTKKYMISPLSYELVEDDEREKYVKLNQSSIQFRLTDNRQVFTLEEKHLNSKEDFENFISEIQGWEIIGINRLNEIDKKEVFDILNDFIEFETELDKLEHAHWKHSNTSFAITTSKNNLNFETVIKNVEIGNQTREAYEVAKKIFNILVERKAITPNE